MVSSVRTYKLDGAPVEEVSFIEATTSGKLATVCAEHLSKGRGVRLVGRIKQERWEDVEGESRSKVVIVAEHVEFQPRRRAPGAADRPRGGRQLADSTGEGPGDRQRSPG